MKNNERFVATERRHQHKKISICAITSAIMSCDFRIITANYPDNSELNTARLEVVCDVPLIKWIIYILIESTSCNVSRLASAQAAFNIEKTKNLPT